MDIFIKRDGTKIVPEFFIHIIGVVLKPYWLRKFQVIQEDYERVCILVVPSIEKSEAQILIETGRIELERMVKLVMGEKCKLEVQLVDAIPSLPSGKYRYTISKVNRLG